MASNKQSDDKSAPLQPKKQKLQRRPLTTQMGSAFLGVPDEDPLSMCLQTFLDPLPTGFELSEKTTNTNRFLEAIEQGLRPKTAAEMEREGKGVPGSQKSAQKSTTSFTTRAQTSHIKSIDSMAGGNDRVSHGRTGCSIGTCAFEAVQVEEGGLLIVRAAGVAAKHCLERCMLGLPGSRTGGPMV
jgi:hypothetical protein